MRTAPAQPGSLWWRMLLLALGLAGLWLALEGRLGLSLSDEGFLWYGVQQTSAGRVPLRDFQSYDPGRYYWCAAGTLLFGQGLGALRVSEAVALVPGLWAGLLAASRLTRRMSLLGACGVMLTVWMFPSHKLFDHALLLISILVAVRLVEDPSAKRVLVTGGFVGFCSFVGRNHALYNLVATGGLLVLLCWKDRAGKPFARICLWVGGIILGALPFLLMLLVVPGFSDAYLASVLSVFKNGTNLGLPIPWRLFALPVFYGFIIILSCCLSAEQLKKQALFCACGFVGMTYLHHAFARADSSHLAQAIHPFTLGVCAAVAYGGLSWVYLWATVTVFAVIALLGGGRQSPLYQRLSSRVPWIQFEAGASVSVPASQARLYDCLRQFAAKNLRAQETLLIAPYTPGLYPILRRPSPLWELYFFFPASVEAQEKDIQRLAAQKVNWALISTSTLDRREDLRFSATHPVLWQHLREHFVPVPQPCLPKTMQLLHRREPFHD